MSVTDGTANPGDMVDEPTLPHPVVRWDLPLEDAEGGVPAPPEGDWEWPSRSRKRGFRVRIPVAVLAALLVGAGGLWGGATLQRTRTASTASSALSSAAANLFRNRGSGTGGSPFTGGGASSAAASGLVTAVEGNVLYITTSSGTLEKVTVSGSTTVTRNAKSSLSGLQPGDTVVVQGSKQVNGSVAATSISSTAPGVSAGGGGGGAFGGG